MKIKRLIFTCFALLVMALPAMAGEFPEKWYWDLREKHRQFEGRPAPALTVGDWVGGEFDVNKMKGHIVVLDLWATWCGTCIKYIPTNNKLAKKYEKDGVKLVGVCTQGDPKKMTEILDAQKAAYPNAFVDGDQVEKDWPTDWFPMYAVIDRAGIVRAIGLRPEKIEAVIEALLAEEAQASGVARILPNWLEGTAEKRARLKNLEQKADQPPALTVDGWRNSEALAIADLKGKVVVLDFWATWSPSNKKTIPKHNALIEKYGEAGLVIIGVCSTFGKETIDDVVKTHKITYPVCTDIENKTNTAYAPDGYSDYYLIDRSGQLRIADCANESLEDAVKALLNEKPSKEQENESKVPEPQESDAEGPKNEAESDGNA